MQMRILVIAPEQLPVPPIKGGSVETNLYQMFRRMAKTDSVTIISRAHPRLPAYSVGAKGRLRIIRIKTGNPKRYIKAAMRKVKRMRFHMIQIENRPTFVPAVRKQFPKTPINISLHSLHFLSKLPAKRADSILRRTNGITSVVGFVTKTMKKRYPRHRNKFRTAMLGVDTRQFKPLGRAKKTRLRKRWGVHGRYNLLFVGRIVPKKGLHTLVKAAAKLKKRYPRIQIVAVGASWPGVKKSTPYMNRVRRLSRRVGVKIKFTGYIPPAHMPKMYHLGDIFVCPTQFREGFATVNSEAMASGIPTVASKRGGIVEVIKHGQSGILVSAYKSSAAFSRAIGWVMRSPGLRKRIVRGARLRAVRKFSWARTVRALKAHYKKVNRK